MDLELCEGPALYKRWAGREDAVYGGMRIWVGNFDGGRRDQGES